MVNARDCFREVGITAPTEEAVKILQAQLDAYVKFAELGKEAWPGKIENMIASYKAMIVAMPELYAVGMKAYARSLGITMNDNNPMLIKYANKIATVAAAKFEHKMRSKAVQDKFRNYSPEEKAFKMGVAYLRALMA